MAETHTAKPGVCLLSASHIPHRSKDPTTLNQQKKSIQVHLSKKCKQLKQEKQYVLILAQNMCVHWRIFEMKMKTFLEIP